MAFCQRGSPDIQGRGKGEDFGRCLSGAVCVAEHLAIAFNDKPTLSKRQWIGEDVNGIGSLK